MVGNLFSDEGQLVSIAPWNRTIANEFLVWIGFDAFQVPVALENFSKDGIVRFLGDSTLSASMVRTEVPFDHLDHTVSLRWLIRNPTYQTFRQLF